MVGVKDGIEYEFIKGDAESKINLVFIHGIGFNKNYFQPVADELKEYNRYLIDLPGHGGSVDLGCDFINYINAVSDFLRTIDNVIVIGHSLGGTITLAVALRRIHTVKGIMVIAGGAESSEYGKELLERINNGIEDLDSFKRSLENVDDKVLDIFNYTESNRIILSDIKAAMSVNILNSISDIEIHSTIVSCEYDKFYPLDQAKSLHEKIKDSKLLVFKEEGTILPFVKKDEILQEIRELVNKIEK